MTVVTAAMCMAVGKVSFDDWLMFTVSLGWRRRSPAMALPRLAMTSFTFMFDCVPEPVCHTTRGKSSSRSPARISSATWPMSAASSSDRRPSRAFARAAAFLSTAKARMTSRGMRSVPMGKFSWLRSVCAPQRAFAGTRISPIESCSMRYSMQIS